MIRSFEPRDIPEAKTLGGTIGDDAFCNYIAGGGGGLVFEEDGRVVGLILYTDDNDGRYVDRLVVSPRARTKGIGRILSDRALGVAPGSDCEVTP